MKGEENDAEDDELDEGGSIWNDDIKDVKPLNNAEEEAVRGS